MKRRPSKGQHVVAIMTQPISLPETLNSKWHLPDKPHGGGRRGRWLPPSPGTVLVREWDRKPHRVMVMPDGYAWNGKTFDSLSKVAFAITRTKWNGPRFFDLRDRQPLQNADGIPNEAGNRTWQGSMCDLYESFDRARTDPDSNSLDAQFERLLPISRARPMLARP